MYDRVMTKTETDDLTAFYGEPIYAYTAAQAVADGALIHFNPATALEAGYTLHVLLTPAAYAEAIEWTRGGGWQSEDARYWDLLNVMRAAAKAALANGRAYRVHVLRVANKTKSGRPSTAEIATRSAALSVRAEGYDGKGQACIIVALEGED